MCRPITSSTKANGSANSFTQTSAKSKKSGRAQIIILTSYPSTVHDIKSIVHIPGEPYPLLDGVIRFRLDQPPPESGGTADSEADEKKPEEMSDADFETINSITQHDVKTLLAEYAEKEEGMWADVTYDEIDITGLPSQSEETAQRVAALTELVGGCLSRRSKEKAGYRAWALTTRKFRVPVDKEVTMRARDAAEQYQSAILPFRTADVSPALGFPPSNAECIWQKIPRYRSYLDVVNALPVAAQTPAGVLFAVCKAVVATVADEHQAATKKNITEFSKLRGGGVQVEWQWTSGPFLGPPSTAFDSSYQHRVLAQGGVGTRGLISFPQLSALAENKMKREEHDALRRMLLSNPGVETVDSSEFPTVDGEHAFDNEPNAIGGLDAIESVMSIICDVQDDTFSSLVRDLLPIPKSIVLQDGCPVIVETDEDHLVTGYSSVILTGNIRQLLYGSETLILMILDIKQQAITL